MKSTIWFKKKATLTPSEQDAVAALAQQCAEREGIALKLELEYKRALWEQGAVCMRNDEFLCFDGTRLVGYLGVGSYGGGLGEVNGIVRTEYRRMGVFSALCGMAKDEAVARGEKVILLLCDRKAAEARSFIEEQGAVYGYSEYEMRLVIFDTVGEVQRSGIRLRQALNVNAPELARQNAIYFAGQERAAEKPERLPEEEAACGMVSYLAEWNGQVIGKVNLQQTGEIGWIYGLGVLPEFRSHGLGRAILRQAIERFRDSVVEVRLQVAAENEKALQLYLSCGFQKVSTMDYYRWSLVKENMGKKRSE